MRIGSRTFLFFFFLMRRQPPRSTLSSSSAASDVYKRQVWKRASTAFASLPLTANIDGRIFCTHGGLPRFDGGADNRLDVLMRPDFPRLESFFQVPEDETPEQRALRQAATDTCWSDPAEDESQLDSYGFGANPRGNGVILFGTEAVTQFLDRFGYEYIFRAHQEKSDGLRLSKNARVFTIFSTCLLYTSPSPRDRTRSRMPSSA
eukprot:TRINITY_DN43083_c0_g1_i1.p1 TRINITY_DN43083_c0_g1~~TRINITY_DN43083_c0_g1_i1.p1  ORF type:complete len:205 (-),score=27.39 TRINITY_DN43083_c0_g1_i1:37-651(-)